MLLTRFGRVALIWYGPGLILSVGLSQLSGPLFYVGIKFWLDYFEISLLLKIPLATREFLGPYIGMSLFISNTLILVCVWVTG